MTEETVTQETAPEAASASQEAPAEAKAPEVATDPAAAPDPAAASPPVVTDTPEEAAAEFVEEPPVPLKPGQTLHAMRGVAAGPADHPRTVHHHKH